jgi:shikimate kinase
MTPSLVPSPAGARLALIGPMAAGKSTLGRKVARLLDVPFLDTDRMVTTEHGPITELFDVFGEAHFRRLEREAVALALQTPGAVVSLGGGAVLDAETRSDLAGISTVFLTVSEDAAGLRLRGSHRPLVRGGIDAWKSIFDERRQVYEELADIRFDTSTRPLNTIAREIAAWVDANVPSDKNDRSNQHHDQENE